MIKFFGGEIFRQQRQNYESGKKALQEKFMQNYSFLKFGYIFIVMNLCEDNLRNYRLIFYPGKKSSILSKRTHE